MSEEVLETPETEAVVEEETTETPVEETESVEVPTEEEATEPVEEEAVEVEKPATEKLGIEETKDVVIFLAKLGSSIAICSMTREYIFTEFLDDIQSVPAALVGVTEVPKEIKDLDSDEIKELLAVVLVELEPLGITTGEAAQHFITAGISLIEGVMELIAGFKATKAE